MMEKGVWVGIIGGITFFLIALLIISYFNSDFDQQLINSVEAGTPEDKLIPQIEKETELEKLNAKRHLDGRLNDMKYWQKSNLDPEDDFRYDMDFYKAQLGAINKCNEIRKKFVRKEISKEQFLSQLKDYKLIVNAQ